MIADVLKDMNWIDAWLPPAIKPYLFDIIGGLICVFVILIILSWLFRIPRKRAKFILDFIDAIKSIFGS